MLPPSNPQSFNDDLGSIGLILPQVKVYSCVLLNTPWCSIVVLSLQSRWFIIIAFLHLLRELDLKLKSPALNIDG